MSINEETKRILDMIEGGTISAAEGARLLDSTRSHSSRPDTTCPYCAENIPQDSARCPECGSPLSQPPIQGATGSAFHALTGLGKVLVMYTLIVSGIELVTHLMPGINVTYGFLRTPHLLNLILAGLGLAAGILMFKGRPAGWSLAILWAVLQIVTLVNHGEVINQQVFHFGINIHTNGQGMGINLVGIVLLILFIKAKPATNP